MANRLMLAVVTILLPVLSACGTISPSQPGSASPPAKVVAYVASGNGTVTPIDTATNRAGPPIAVGGGAGPMVATPDGRTLYVATESTPGTVVPISTATNLPDLAIRVGGSPDAVAITPDGKTVYVVDYLSGSVIPISTTTNKAAPAIPVGASPFAIAITPDGKTAYVTNNGGASGDTVTPINIATNTAAPAVTVGTGPWGVAITPDGKTAYIVDNVSGTVTPISTATNIPGSPIAVGRQPENIVITPDGKTAYVTDSDADTVTAINVAANTAGAAIKVGDVPYDVVIAPDGKTAYASSAADTVIPISIASNTPGTPVPVPRDPIVLAITPDGKTVYAVTSNVSTVTPINTATNTAGPAIPVGAGPQDILIARTHPAPPVYQAPGPGTTSSTAEGAPARGSRSGVCTILTAQEEAAILGSPAQGYIPSSNAPDDKLCTYGLGPVQTAKGLKFHTLSVIELQCGSAAQEAWPYYKQNGESVGGGVWTADRVKGYSAGVRLRNGCVLSAIVAISTKGKIIPGSRDALYRALAAAAARS